LVRDRVLIFLGVIALEPHQDEALVVAVVVVELLASGRAHVEFVVGSKRWLGA
jgi:hypothetical protein